MHGFPWLAVVTFAPLAGALVLAFVPSRNTAAIRWWSLVVTLATFGLALGMLAQFQARAGFQLVEDVSWIGPLHARFLLGVDGISVFMVVLTSFLMPVAVLSSWRVERRAKTYFLAFLVLETAVLGSFLALDLLLFFVFFEAMLVPMYLIIGGFGGRRRISAAVKFFLYTMAGSAFLLLGILFLYFRAGAVFGQPTFDLRRLEQLPLAVTTARWLFLAFLAAFAVKVPLVPVHTWLSDAYGEAPTAGTFVLSALLAKVGAYGLIRFGLTLFPEPSAYFRGLVMTLAVISIVYGAIVAIGQTDLKRVVAYSSVSHLGFVVLGTFAIAGTLAAGTQALSGAVLYMVNHGISTGALFLLVGMLAERTRTRTLGEFGGVGKEAPLLAGMFLFASLASVGLPGLNNFVSEFLVLLGTFQDSVLAASFAVTALILSAIYLLWAYQRAFHGPVVAPALAPIAGGSGHAASPAAATPEGGRPRMRDLSVREWVVIAPLAAAMLFLGVYPRPLLSRIEPTAQRAVACQQVRSAPLPRGALTLTRQEQQLLRACGVPTAGGAGAVSAEGVSR